MPENYQKPKSMCECGCLGDGPNSAHEDNLQFGHGRCKTPGCDCIQFTWIGFLLSFEEYLKRTKSPKRRKSCKD
jgi:hypothetical protein